MNVRRSATCLLFGSVIFYGLCACQPVQSAARPWQYADLRWLDDVDAPAPEYELTAIGSRIVGRSLEFRVELLDVPEEASYTLYLLLDLLPGSPANPYLDLPIKRELLNGAELVVAYAPEGRHRAWLVSSGPLDGMQLRIQRAPTLDWLELSLSSVPLSGSNHLWKATLMTAPTANPQNILDTAGPFSSRGQPPPQAQILLGFWDAFPAESPAQALRYWDGAHAGPYGERHGLSRLLAALRRSGLPFILLDAGEPEVLSALDYIEGLPVIQNLVASGQLTVASASDAIPSTDLVAAFSLPTTVVTYQANRNDPVPARTQLLLVLCCSDDAPEAAPWITPLRSGRSLLFPLPPVAPDQINRQGFSLEARRQLVQSALARQQPGVDPILLFGGSLPVSAWGDELAAEEALAYLQARPWIAVFSADDLVGQRPSRRSLNEVSLHPDLPQQLNTLPAPVPGSDAWFAWRTITRPARFPTPHYQELQAAYAGVVPLLATMQDWAADPWAGAACTQDFDGDGIPDCYLASRQILAVFDSTNGSLMLLAARNTCPQAEQSGCESGYTQIVGPMAQLAIGLSDPSTWEYHEGRLQDPAVLPGGFRNRAGAARVYMQGERLVVEQPGATLAYQLLPDRLRVQLHCDTAQSCTAFDPRLPLIIAPRTRFQPDWRRRYISVPVAQGWQLGWQAGPQIVVHSPAIIRVDSFIDSNAPSDQPENPDREVPPGHFFPFPLTVVRFDFAEDTLIDLQLVPESELITPVNLPAP